MTKNIFKEARDILNYKYSWKREIKTHSGKISVILSDDEANELFQAIMKAERLQWLLELEDELRETETEIRRLQKINEEYVPPLDDYISGENARVEYLKDRIFNIRQQLFSEAKTTDNAQELRTDYF